jgi:hypothetical protein
VARSGLADEDAAHHQARARSEYDHRMLQLHDLAKADLDYQKSVPQQEFQFPPGSTWIVFSDQRSMRPCAARP